METFRSNLLDNSNVYKDLVDNYHHNNNFLKIDKMYKSTQIFNFVNKEKYI